MNNEAIDYQQNPVNKEPLSNPEALKQFTGFFELLSQIDQRLKEEDSQYKAKYYPNKL